MAQPPPCRFDAAVGESPHGMRCGKPTVADCTIRNGRGERMRCCEDHLRCYAGNYITWWERDAYNVIVDHDMGDC